MYIIDIYLSPVSPSTYTIYIYLQEHLLSPETAAPTRLFANQILPTAAAPAGPGSPSPPPCSPRRRSARGEPVLAWNFSY